MIGACICRPRSLGLNSRVLRVRIGCAVRRQNRFPYSRYGDRGASADAAFIERPEHSISTSANPPLLNTSNSQFNASVSSPSKLSKMAGPNLEVFKVRPPLLLIRSIARFKEGRADGWQLRSLACTSCSLSR